MVLYPTEEWLDEYQRLLNESTELDDFGFDENLLLVITDLDLDAITFGDLSERVRDELPATVNEGLEDVSLAEATELIDESVRTSLPDPMRNLLEQADRDAVDETIYVYIELQDGSCPAISLVDDPSDRDVGSVFRASAHTWQSIIAGRPATAAVISGDLEIIGNELMKLQNTAELQLLCDLAADVETEFLIEHDDTSFVTFLLDESIRQPITVQKCLTRQAALTVQTLSPF